MRKTIIAIAIVGAGFGLTACGTAATPAAAPAAPATVTIQPSAPAAAPVVPAAPVQPTAPVAPAPSPAPVAAPSSAPAEAPAPVRVPMPDVVGMNLQAAQNKIQEAGVFFSRSEDATGAGRHQVVDSNWTVVAQTPDAGQLVGEGDALLSVVKNTD